MAFINVVPPKAAPPRSQIRQTRGFFAFTAQLRANLSLSSWLLIGGLIQTTLAFFIPRLYILLPTLFILLSRFAYSLAVTFDLVSNPYLKDAIPFRTSALVPNLDGEFSDKGASEKVVCFHLGAKYNHPFGIFAPNIKEIGDRFAVMIKELDANISNNGYLGGTSYSNVDHLGATEICFISYWRTIEAIHEFAYGPTHREAWNWWNSLTHSESKHIGINHEIFCAEPGQWEAIYVNHQPTMLGATTYLRKGDKMVGGTVDDQWINGLMDARKGKLRSSAGRLGWQPEKLYEKYDHAPPKVEYEQR